MKKVCVFPGQGSQKVGMGRDFYDAFDSAKLIFERANDFLHMDLKNIIFNDPDSLQKTVYAQPALMTVSYAMFNVMAIEFDISIKDFSFALGHSLGEYTAIAVNNSFSFEDTLLVLKNRAEAMEKAVPDGKGGMCAVLGLTVQKIQQIDLGDVAIANDNSAQQVIISGLVEDLEEITPKLLEHGAKKVVKLSVSGPFHSPYMVTVSECVKNILSTIEKRDPIIPIISNVTAKPECDINKISSLLEKQVVTGVRWRESIESLSDFGVDTVIEIGSGTVLSGLCKRINKDLNVFNIETPVDIENLKRQEIL